MKRAAAIVTNRGGRTCHAAIIARELGVPAVVGTGNGLDTIKEGQTVTISCAEGDTGYIYEGALPFERHVADLDKMPPAPLKVMMNVANPERAFDFAMLCQEAFDAAGGDPQRAIVQLAGQLYSQQEAQRFSEEARKALAALR